MGEVEKLKIFLEAENTHFQESIKKKEKTGIPWGNPLLQMGAEFSSSTKIQRHFVYLTRSLWEGVLKLPK